MLFAPSGKGRKRQKKGDFGRFPGREARHPLNPHLSHPHLRQPKFRIVRSVIQIARFEASKASRYTPRKSLCARSPRFLLAQPRPDCRKPSCLSKGVALPGVPQLHCCLSRCNGPLTIWDDNLPTVRCKIVTYLLQKHFSRCLEMHL